MVIWNPEVTANPTNSPTQSRWDWLKKRIPGRRGTEKVTKTEIVLGDPVTPFKEFGQGKLGVSKDTNPWKLPGFGDIVFRVQQEKPEDNSSDHQTPYGVKVVLNTNGDNEAIGNAIAHAQKRLRVRLEQPSQINTWQVASEPTRNGSALEFGFQDAQAQVDEKGQKPPIQVEESDIAELAFIFEESYLIQPKQ